MPVGQWERRSVRERRTLPSRRVVALLTLSRKPCANVTWIRSRLEVVRVARCARRGKPCVHAGRRMTRSTSPPSVRVGQCETCRMLEACTLPLQSVVALRAVCSKAQRNVIRVCCPLEVVRVARRAIR